MPSIADCNHNKCIDDYNTGDQICVECGLVILPTENISSSSIRLSSAKEHLRIYTLQLLIYENW